VTMSVARGESETGTGSGKGMDSIGHLVPTQRSLLEERKTLISGYSTVTLLFLLSLNTGFHIIPWVVGLNMTRTIIGYLRA